jgi:hypothetical protein
MDMDGHPKEVRILAQESLGSTAAGVLYHQLALRLAGDRGT